MCVVPPLANEYLADVRLSRCEVDAAGLVGEEKNDIPARVKDGVRDHAKGRGGGDDEEGVLGGTVKCELTLLIEERQGKIICGIDKPVGGRRQRRRCGLLGGELAASRHG